MTRREVGSPRVDRRRRTFHRDAANPSVDQPPRDMLCWKRWSGDTESEP